MSADLVVISNLQQGAGDPDSPWMELGEWWGGVGWGDLWVGGLLMITILPTF